MIDWLPQLVGRLPVTIRTKLLAAFLSVVAMFIVLGAAGLWVLHGADRRSDELINLQRQIAAYQKLQGNTTELLYTVTSTFLAKDARTLEILQRKISQFGYDFDRVEFIGRDRAELVERIRTDYADLIDKGAAIAEAIAAGNLDDARRLQADEALPLADRINRNTFALINGAESDMLAAADAGSHAFTVSQLALVGIAVASILLAVTLGYAMSSSLLTPLRASTPSSGRSPPATSPAASRSPTATSWASSPPTSTAPSRSSIASTASSRRRAGTSRTSWRR
ncbi:MAG: hypothetical protein U1E14_10095 [Geminicoccaceae bacterium]